MNRDEIERQLRRPGPREDGYVPVALPTGARANRQQGRGGGLLTAARVGVLTVAVVAGAAIAVLLTRGGLPLPGNHGTGSGSPTQNPVASRSPNTIAGCHADDFAWSTDPWGGAAGARGTSVLLRGVTSLVACEIGGSASLELRDSNGQLLLSAQTPASAVKVNAGTLLEVGVTWSNWCASAPATPLTLTLTLPGDAQKAPLVASAGEIPIPPCSGIGQGSVLSATDFQYSTRAAPEG
ncbi:MAG: hypothetical protein ABI578_06645 [Chloroflexota bacterium]